MVETMRTRAMTSRKGTAIGLTWCVIHAAKPLVLRKRSIFCNDSIKGLVTREIWIASC